MTSTIVETKTDAPEIMIKPFGLLKLALGISMLAALSEKTFAAPKPAPRPNIVFVLTDDLRWDDLSCYGHPFVKTPNIDRVAREGARFNNAFVTTPVSRFSRSGLFTGEYAHNRPDANGANFATLLRDAGYETAFVGEWHSGTNAAPRAGFNYWVSAKGAGQFLSPDLNINGKQKKIKNDYVTDVFTDYAVDFLKRDHTKPFLLCLSHKMIEPASAKNSEPASEKFVSAPRHKNLYAKTEIPRRPNVGAPVGKPALQREIAGVPALSEKSGTDDETIRNRLRMLAAIDESMERIFEILQDTKQLENTLIIFTSDEGYFYGEHGLSSEGRLAYEESIRVPMLMRWPKLIQPKTQVNEMVLNLDIAPTLLEIAGVPAQKSVQGRSVAQLFQTSPAQPKLPWRNSFLVEYFGDSVPRVQNLNYQAVRTDGWIYIHYTELDNMDELYDLKWDPYQQKNLMWEPAAQNQLMKMQMELVKLMRETNPESGASIAAASKSVRR